MSLTFKGVSLPTYVRVLKVTRSILPPSHVKLLEIDSRIGAYFVKKKHGFRQIEVEVAVIGSSASDLRNKVRSLAEYLDSDKPEPLICSDEPALTDFAILDGETDLEEIIRFGTGTLVFLCPQPYSQGAARNATGASITYNGTAPCFPKLSVTFTSSVTHFEITKSSTGEKLRVNGNMGTTSTLIIDCNTGKVTINGVLNQQALSFDSDFFALTKGTNTFTISTGATVRFDWTELFK